MRILYIFILLGLFATTASAQILVSGTVLDKSKVNYVEGAKVVSTNGQLAYTDSMGRYAIRVNPSDSLFFVYNNKPTQKFAVSSIPNTDKFDISILVPVAGKYKALQEVIVYTKSYRQDSTENRETYRDIFGYKKPGLSTSITPGGGVGADLDEIINIFRFKRNKSLRAFQKRLEGQEQDKYIDYRFSRQTVRRITQLKSPALDTFLVWYRPSYEFASRSSEIDFNQYILNALYQFQRISPLAAKKEEETGAN